MNSRLQQELFRMYNQIESALDDSSFSCSEHGLCDDGFGRVDWFTLSILGKISERDTGVSDWPELYKEVQTGHTLQTWRYKLEARCWFHEAGNITRIEVLVGEPQLVQEERNLVY